ncbi:hypothetical protein ASPZODRAFT_57175 [Penicilliopsis zonata CBS 506.65]|uniref:Exonuclease domain-containing protein n=1 Tax=Penicilliopsis zonata CBS 506.65 TaxID=1073090 RepID=A0A1L9SWF2_9EURO|nr:hypothetical protein ASPZODRAFT_57175 [Penicilliopsis zonata CBS 506.65]OJJ51532.1 hypothetical protein ASPZODRAFT_57175 [Penicilliopsis zonata CBS 506.65]
MPCFKGLAVSIHTPDGPISEYSIQRQSRASRIACYIPVPPPKIPEAGNGKPEQSTFAISITLLNPGQDVPYSTPKPTAAEPTPKPKKVGGLSATTEEHGKYSNSVAPYQALTNSPNETVAAYIYFDGRQKEEVATLLRRGEETWVNSRWVSVPQSEGGGLAEREFLFREVGLERWLNGLDLEGKDVAAKIERRRQKMEKRRLKREAEANGGMDLNGRLNKEDGKGVMRYGNDEKSPLEDVSDDDMSSDSDDDPIPESAGQIKVALVRVLASGEIKRGEYSPQFDAHDDDDDAQGQGNNGADDIDHTTSFAKPKTLDPKSISTQTVTGIDPADKPYAVFTFMYRGERQLQKMGILKDTKTQETPASVKRRSLQPDFANLGPLKPGGGVGFLNFRDSEDKSKGRRKSGDAEMDSDDDDDDSILGKADEEEGKDANQFLSPDDIQRQGELAEGVRKIKLKRQHSAEPLAASKEDTSTAAAAAAAATAASTAATSPPGSRESPLDSSSISTTPPNAATTTSSELAKVAANSLNGEFIGSPLKKQRASVSGPDESALRRRIESGLANNIGDVLSGAPAIPAIEEPKPSSAPDTFQAPAPTQPPASNPHDEDEELSAAMPLTRSSDPLVWIDCEMTGLDSETDQIIQICCFITDADLNLLEPEGFETIIHQPDATMSAMSEWCIDTHSRSGLTAAVQASTITPSTAASSLLAYIQRYVPQPRVGLLAGNSVHADKAFLAKGPYAAVLQHLHYRIVDVSTIKEAARRWASDELLREVPPKREVHLARDDILESIEEMRFYREKLFSS